jgi:hypothetical protein
MLRLVRQVARQHQDGFCIGGRKTMVSRGLPIEPLPFGVLAGTQGDRHCLRHTQPKHALCVAADFGVVAPAPSRVNVVHIFKLPVLQMAIRVQCIQPGFFLNLADGRFGPGFGGVVFAARHRLPGACIGTADQQDLALWVCKSPPTQIQEF